MFNLLNLDPLEFEKFCLDFMEKKLNIEFKRFGPGKDDGIDLVSLDGKIICQCKRYKDSSKLRNVCLKEYETIKKQKFEKYYLITTAEIGETVTQKIYSIFSDFMMDLSHIIGKNNIDDFLSDERNIDVLKKNHKLWLSSSMVLDLYLNRYSDAVSKVLINDFESETKYFVETKAYRDAIKLIDYNGIILLIGEPGIGKTLTSKMIIRYLLINNKKYRLTSVSNNDISKLIESVHQNDEPEIIFLDDFLGQTCLSIDDKLINELKTLLKLTKIYNNKKVILNSRITILNKAKYEKQEFEKLLDEIGIKECMINVNDLTILDRARILYNLMYYNHVPLNYFKNIKDDKKYNNIINHKSFNTRIIEMSIKRANDVNSNQFYEFIINSLNNPQSVWKSEFERIELVDVILMYQLFTLGDNYIPIDILKKATINYLYKNDYKLDRYSFNDSVNRLCNSLIRIVILNKKKYVSVLNPSINDYIQKYLLDNILELKKILKNSLYIEQVEKIVNLDRVAIKEIAEFEKLDAYNSYNSIISEQYLDFKKKINFILKFSYMNNKIIGYVRDLYKYDIGTNYLIKLSLDNKIRDFYDLKIFINDVKNMSHLCRNADYDYINNLYEYYSDEGLQNNLVEEHLNDVYIDSLEWNLVSIGEDTCNDFINNDSPEEKFKNEDDNLIINDDYVLLLHERIESELRDRNEEFIKKTRSYDYDINVEIDFNSVIDRICVESILNDDLNSLLVEMNNENISDNNFDFEVKSHVTVEDIFNQKYENE